MSLSYIFLVDHQLIISWSTVDHVSIILVYLTERKKKRGKKTKTNKLIFNIGWSTVDHEFTNCWKLVNQQLINCWPWSHHPCVSEEEKTDKQTNNQIIKQTIRFYLIPADQLLIISSANVDHQLSSFLCIWKNKNISLISADQLLIIS